MADDDDVTIDEDAVYDFFRDEDGPIGDLMRDLAEQIAVVAVAKAPVRTIPDRHRTGITSNAQPPGYLKSHITTTVGHAVTYDGLLFGGANAPGDPGLFMELPAEQIHEKHPFLSTGLESLWVD